MIQLCRAGHKTLLTYSLSRKKVPRPIAAATEQSHYFLSRVIDVGTRRKLADDTSFFVPSTQEAVRCLSRFSGLVSNIWSTCLQAKDQNPEYRFGKVGVHKHPTSLLIATQWPEQVGNFIYLGSNQSSDGGSQSDMKRHIVLASSVHMSSL